MLKRIKGDCTHQKQISIWLLLELRHILLRTDVGLKNQHHLNVGEVGRAIVLTLVNVALIPALILGDHLTLDHPVMGNLDDASQLPKAVPAGRNLA